MKKYFILIFLAGLSIITSAQQDANAKIILDKLSKITKSHAVIQAEFKIEYQNIKDNFKNQSTGSISMKGNMYRLNFMSAETFFDGKTQWNYLEDANEVNILEPSNDDEDIFNNPKKIFTIYEEDFKYQLINELNEKGVNYSIIDLYPSDLTEEYSRIRLQINTDKYFLYSATIFGKDGSHYTITINKYDANLKLDDSFFIFDPAKYKNIEIIDMR